IPVRTAIITDVANRGILNGKTVFNVLGNPVVELFGFEIGVVFVPSDLLRQRADLRGENHMGSFHCKSSQSGIAAIQRVNLFRLYIEPNPLSCVSVFYRKFRWSVLSCGLFQIKTANSAFGLIACFRSRRSAEQLKFALEWVLSRNWQPRTNSFSRWRGIAIGNDVHCDLKAFWQNIRSV